MEGKYFVLVSKHCNLTLGIQDNSNQEGTLAVLCNKNEYEPHQVWYEEIATGTIRSKANDLCLTVTEGENRIRLASYKPGDQSQQWRVSGGVVHHRVYHNKVLDIVDGRQDCGAVLCSWDFHSGPNQQWEVQYLPPRLFYIVSELNGLVLDIAGASQDPGAKLILWDKKGSDAKNQLWYEDRSGFLRSALNNFAPDGSTAEITMQPFAEDNPNRCWFIYGSTIYLGHKQDQVFDIVGSRTEAGTSVGVYQSHGGPNQKWYQEFVN